MDIENLITETFTAHEHVAPDDETVLAAARQRIERRRTVSRPLVVGAGVVALTLAAGAVVVLTRPDPVSGPVAGTPDRPPVAAPAIADLTMPFNLGWLPPGTVDYLARRINIGATAADPRTPLYGGEYMLTVTANGQVLRVDVQQFKMTPVRDAAFKSGPGSPVTVNGQPGVESAVADGPSGYELYVAHPDGGSMYVSVAAGEGSTASAQRLIDTGRRIAQGIRFPGTATVTPSFGLGALPNGMRVCAFDVEKGLGAADGAKPSTGYSLGSCVTLPEVIVSVTNPNGPRGVPGQPVQGHETSYTEHDGYRSLWILDALDGAPILVAGAVPAADLYGIANGLVLPTS